MKKRLLSLILVAAMVVTSIAGCGKTEESAPADGVVNEEANETTEVEKVVVRYQTWNTDEVIVNEIIDAFEKENPDIDVEYIFYPYVEHLEKLKIEMVSGDAADVYAIQEGTAYTEFRDFQEDLTGYLVDSYGENWADDYNDFNISMLDADGKFYGVPLLIGYAGLAWANMEIMNKYDLEVPRSLDDLRTASKVLRENGEFPLAIGAKDDWINIDTWMSIANDINSEKLYAAIEGEAAFTDADLIQSFEIWQTLFEEGIFQDGALGVNMYTDTTDLYNKEGSIPMLLDGSWAACGYMAPDSETQAVYNGENSDHECFLIDWNNDGKVAPVTAATGEVICINANSEVKDAAWKFVDFMIHEGQEIQVNKYLKNCPTINTIDVNVEGLSEDGSKNLDFIVEQGSNNTAGYREMPYSELKQTISDQLASLALGEVTPEDAAEIVETASQNQAR